MESATVHTAAQTTGWSVRMLHYLDAAGLVTPPRSPSGYRLYGEREIAHLRGLRQLLADHDLRPADLQVALRLRSEPALRHAVDDWLDATSVGAQPVIGADQDITQGSNVPRESTPAQSTSAQSTPAQSASAHSTPAQSTSWLRFEQDKHTRALQYQRQSTPSKETA